MILSKIDIQNSIVVSLGLGVVESTELQQHKIEKQIYC